MDKRNLQATKGQHALTVNRRAKGFLSKTFQLKGKGCRRRIDNLRYASLAFFALENLYRK